MKPQIEFATQKEMEAASRLFPATKPRTKPVYGDLILKPEHQSLRYTLPQGQTCVRILPQLAGASGWMHGIQVLAHPHGQHVHPKSLKPTGNTKGKSVFDTAYGWIRANKPDLLFSKTNRDGYRLLPSPMAICWLLVEIGGKMQAKLFVGSAYDGGAAGGNCGIAHQLFRLARDLSSDGHDAAHAEHGSQIIVEKTTPHGAKYPTYKMTRASVEAPISRYLEQMDETEIEAIRPLHEVIRHVKSDEEWELLSKVIGEELRDEIRAATSAATSTPAEAAAPTPQPERAPEPMCEEPPEEWFA